MKNATDPFIPTRVTLLVVGYFVLLTAVALLMAGCQAARPVPGKATLSARVEHDPRTLASEPPASRIR